MEIIIVGLVCLIMLCLIEVYYELHHFQVVNYQIKSSKLVEPVRFVVLSDLHNKQYGVQNKKLLDAIDLQNPAAILLAGDMFTAKNNTNYKDTLDFLAVLSEKYPTYLGLGNHETRISLYRQKFPELYDAVTEGVKNSSLRVLANQSIDFPDAPIAIHGLEIAHSYYGRMQEKALPKGYISELLGSFDCTKLNILLAHNPIYFDEYVASGADIILSGHVHGGIVKVPFLGGVISPSLKLFPKYDAGLFKKNESRMILSRGIGNHTIPLRFLNKAECIILDVLPE